MNRSDLGGAHVAPRVLPDKRGRGVGTALLTRLAELAVERGFERAGSHVAGADERSIAFARRFGFEETRRDVKQVLELDDAPPPTPRDIDGVEFVSIESRPELLREAWPLGAAGLRGHADRRGRHQDRQLAGRGGDAARRIVRRVRRRRDRRLRGPDALAGRTDEVRARADGRSPRLAPARPRDCASSSARSPGPPRTASASSSRGRRRATRTCRPSTRGLGYVTTEIDLAFARSLPLDDRTTSAGRSRHVTTSRRARTSIPRSSTTTVDFLASSLAGGGALELAIGTGRIALPLLSAAYASPASTSLPTWSLDCARSRAATTSPSQSATSRRRPSTGRSRSCISSSTPSTT